MISALRVHRYTERTGRARHTFEVPFPAWAWRLAVRRGARRDPVEIGADHVRALLLECREAGPAKFDYWAATEAPKTEAA